MRYRKLADDGDYRFGHRSADMLVDTPAAVAQAIKTRLELATGDWFLDLTEGTPYFPNILGHGTSATYDITIKQRIIETPGVLSLDEYQSSLDPDTRQLTITCLITTIYGAVAVTIAPIDTSGLNFGRLDVDFVLDESLLYL